MMALDKKYEKQLETLKSAIQSSEALQRYLDDEEEEDFKELQTTFEPGLEELHALVASENPLQLLALEEKMLDPALEGLFLPRLLGYSVLRGEINENFKYVRPQHHFKNILLNICNSSNFDMLKLRIGQTIQIGFSLSSRIWITNVLNEVDNKKVKNFLEEQNQDKYRDIRTRQTSLVKYQKQFVNYNFLSAPFPETLGELNVMANETKAFMLYRAFNESNNISFLPQIESFIKKNELAGHLDYVKILMISAACFDFAPVQQQLITSQLDALRKNYPDFENVFFEILYLMLHHDKYDFGADQDKRFAQVLNVKVKDELTKYYTLVNTVHTLGYVHEDSIEAVRVYYDQHSGLSKQNACIRTTILKYIRNLMLNLDENSYHDYFELNKVFVQYMAIFSNEQFNQSIKNYSLNYIKKLIKYYPDKRGRDYQDVKKFVTTTFTDLGFLKPKEIVELFKTKRKKKE